MRVHRQRGLAGRRPRVTVVIPCYNYGHYLPQAVASALDQRGIDVDVLIVDDASPDGSADVARALAAADDRVDLLVHEENQGHIATYNDGLGRATGDYVVLLSADDLLTTDSLSRSVALMEHHPDVALVYGYAADFEHETPAVGTGRTWWSTWSSDEWLRLVSRRGRNIIVNPEAIMRTSVMREIGGYGSEHPHAADMEMWMKAAVRGRVGRVNGPVQAGYRVHGANMHVTVYGGLLVDARAVRAVYESFFGAGGDGSSLRRAPKLREAARRAVVSEALLAARRPAVGSREAVDLIDFAVASDPGLRSSLAWRVHRVTQAGGMRLWSPVVGRLEDVRWALRWRKWRRFGT